MYALMRFSARFSAIFSPRFIAKVFHTIHCITDWCAHLKHGFCKEFLRYKWTSDQLNTFWPDQCWSGQTVRKNVFNWSEVHLYRCNFLQNPYFNNYFRNSALAKSIKRHKETILCWQSMTFIKQKKQHKWQITKTMLTNHDSYYLDQKGSINCTL